MKTYREIVFLQREDDFGAFCDNPQHPDADFFDADVEDQIAYLSLWDYGDNYGEPTEDLGAGPQDDVVTHAAYPQYVMVLNRGLGYAGLSLVEGE